MKKVAVAMSGHVNPDVASGHVARKVAVALSGGVDSGVAAALLVKEGYDCTGFHMHLWHEPHFVLQCRTSRGKRVENFENKCCSTESLEAARKTAHLLGMPFYTIDFADIFKNRVVDYFLKAYASGLTPNPCVACNKYIKFGELLDYVRKLGFDYLATGHYARVIRDTGYEKRNTKYEDTSHISHITYHLLSAHDKKKDQTYFLYNLTHEQLTQVLFPVGDCLKKDVIKLAKKMKLPVAHRPESQEICFFPENDYREFLKRQIPGKLISGEVVDLKGNTIGRHSGLPLYTIGQRHGFELMPKSKGWGTKIIPPYYVIGKEVKNNHLIVGFGKETERREFEVEDVNWLAPRSPVLQNEVRVKIRHQGELLLCRIIRDTGYEIRNTRNEIRSTSHVSLITSRLSRLTYRVLLSEPERGITPGQSAVFYRKLRVGQFEVLGGGIISIDRS